MLWIFRPGARRRQVWGKREDTRDQHTQFRGVERVFSTLNVIWFIIEASLLSTFKKLCGKSRHYATVLQTWTSPARLDSRRAHRTSSAAPPTRFLFAQLRRWGRKDGHHALGNPWRARRLLPKAWAVRRRVLWLRPATR